MRWRGRSRTGYVVVGLVLGIMTVGTVGRSMLEVARPSSVHITHADGIVVHATGEARLDVGRELAEKGVAPVLVISSGGWAPGSDLDVGPHERTSWGLTGAEMAALCRRENPYEVLCVPASPANTIGEARAFGAVAESRGWRSVAVVTDRAHLRRALVSVSQCTDAELFGVAPYPDSRPGSARTTLDEWLRIAATRTFMRAC